MTTAQLHSTASYQVHDLAGTDFGGNDLTGADLGGQNLANANFGSATLTANFSQANLTSATFDSATLTGADLSQANLTSPRLSANLTNANFSQANLTNARLGGTLTGHLYQRQYSRGESRQQFVPGGTNGITTAQLYSTASYQAHDLTRVNFTFNFNLSSANFVDQNLSGANLTGIIGTGANFTGAKVQGAGFSVSFPNFSVGPGISSTQLYSTASYQAHDLSGIRFNGNDRAVGISPVKTLPMRTSITSISRTLT